MYMYTQEFEKTKNGADKPLGTDKPRPADQQAATSITMTTIPVAPPPALANPDKPVSNGGGGGMVPTWTSIINCVS